MKKGYKEMIKIEKEVAKFAFASVCSIRPIEKGEKLSKKNIWVKRPGTGDFLAVSYNTLLGKTALKNIKENSQIKKKDIGSYIEDKKDGEWRAWYYNGQRYYKRNYKNGQKHGPWTWWYDNGQKKYQGNYSNGKKNGEWFEWTSNGELVISGFYKNGKKWDGLFKGIKYSSGKKVSS